MSAEARLRLARPDDGPALADIYGPAVTDAATSFELVAPDAAEMTRRVERLTGWTPWLACERGDGVIGYAYATAHRDRPAYQWSVDVSVYVAPAAQRGGVGRALYAALLALLVRQGFRNAYAGITLPNAPSVALHESMGFAPLCVYRRVGFKHGRWHDVAWLERTLAPHDPDPRPPIAFPLLLGTAALDAALAEGSALLRRPAG